MPISTIDHQYSRFKNPKNKTHSTPNHQFSNTNDSNVSKNKKKFMSMSFGVLGCKGKLNSPIASAPEVIRSAAQWESSSKQMRKNRRKKMPTLTTSTRNSTNVVCCAPPGIGSAFDVAPRPKTRSNNKEHSRIARRTTNGEAISRSHTSNTRHYCPRSHHRPHIMILRHNLHYTRDIEGDDYYGSWRLDVDDMSYEQLVELSDKIGYVGTGLEEEKIVEYIRKFKLSTIDSYSMVISTDKSWRCTICQEGYKVDDEIGKLECGHYHHIECIKKWLMHKNACPICKIEAIHEN
ncbi:E3 ubiquitin-protein ligase MBR2-like isoform X3 [Solanum stenotomum]|uniref:E3 ubiquitin-protein ligase MBR2-like isoform X3 n=1 Tax=Solanum stenotomum TaxID=172797 RepID=UPI0020D0971C|nr:E3 ubiquitin-protein ligase MBR2-like isoform X3 [Solanum stenotomum]